MAMSALRMWRGAAFAAVLLTVPFAAPARSFDGVVTHVGDGDSLWVRPAGEREAVSVRLQGIDAPELCQPFGREAREALAGRALHRQVTVQTRARDRYERLVARVHAGPQDLGAWMVGQGYAWSAAWRGSGGPYAREQNHAMRARLGLWRSAAPVHPREFRRRHGSCRPA